MKFFVAERSVVRTIWGNSDTILFIFAGASAEFALNKAVDWLYFTGRLPSDPIGRLFLTVRYARQIVFAQETDALKAIDKITAIHKEVEGARGAVIPDWAYRDVLFMLIYYSIASFELLERKLTALEKEEVYQVFYKMGLRMGLKELPSTYYNWLSVREIHMKNDLQKTNYTNDLLLQYKKHLGSGRYKVLLEAQKLVVPQQVSDLLNFSKYSLLLPLVSLYKLSRVLKLQWMIKKILLPSAYHAQIRELDHPPVG